MVKKLLVLNYSVVYMVIFVNSEDNVSAKYAVFNIFARKNDFLIKTYAIFA